jgi:hypothetical protein
MKDLSPMRLRTLGAVCASCAAAAPSTASTADAAAAAAPRPATLPAGGPTPPVAVPADMQVAAMRELVDRHVRLEQRHARAQGERLSRSERRTLRARLRALAPAPLRARTRALRHDIRSLLRRLERRDGGAPDVAIPAALDAIARCESGGDPRAVSAGGSYRGKYQFSSTTWRSVGGTGDPAAAAETEQDRRAAILYRSHGAGQWPVCGR